MVVRRPAGGWVGVPHQCPLGLVASYLIYADVQLHILMADNNAAGWQRRAD